VNSVVLVIHGTLDQEIPLRHGLEIYEACRQTVTPLWVEGGDHNRIPYEYPTMYYSKLNDFIGYVRSLIKVYGEDRLLQMCKPQNIKKHAIVLEKKHVKQIQNPYSEPTISHKNTPVLE
jgi:hypothetical protein